MREWKRPGLSRLIMVAAVLVVAGCIPVGEIVGPGNDDEVEVGTIVQFTGEASDSSGSPIVEWQWDFGDGETTTTTAGTAFHVYDDPGVYTASLIVMNGEGKLSVCNPGTGCEVMLVANELPCTSSAGTDCRGRITIDGMKVRYWRNYPLGTANNAIRRAVIIQHGNSRNADDYFGDIIDAAATEGASMSTLILAPNFITTDDAPAGDELVWTSGGWKKGNLSDDAYDISSFDVMDDIFDRLATPGRFPNLEKITLVGHSAGGQYVNRFAGGSEAEDAPDMSGLEIRYIIANPSSYMYLSDERALPGSLDDFETPEAGDCPEYNEYKYGLEDRNTYMSQVTSSEIRSMYTARDVVILLGLNDNDPNASGLDTGCEAMYQGDHRLERGIIFYNHLCDYHDCSNQLIHFVPGVGHDHTDMFTSNVGRADIFF